MQSLNTPSPVPTSLFYLCTGLFAFEILLTLSDLVDLGLREVAILTLGLWPMVWDTIPPLFSGQPYSMLVTHAAVHGDIMHAVFNCIALVIFGRVLMTIMPAKKFYMLLLAGILIGAFTYLMLDTTGRPAVGISGGVYAIGGYWVTLVMRDKYQETRSWNPVIGIMGLVVFITLIMPLFTPGAIAWEAHLGGLLTGMLWAGTTLGKSS